MNFVMTRPVLHVPLLGRGRPGPRPICSNAPTRVPKALYCDWTSTKPTSRHWKGIKETLGRIARSIGIIADRRRKPRDVSNAIKQDRLIKKIAAGHR